MDVAIVAPCPVPYARGGAESLWSSLQDHLNTRTSHQAEIIKLPSPERSLWEIVDSYRRFAALDLSGFDVVVSGKYPAWMVDHPAHLCYLLHRLRGLYDTYHYFGLPEDVDGPAREAAADVLDLMDAHPDDRAALPEVLDRLDALRARADRLPPELTAFPGPFVRALVHWLDGVGLHPSRVRRHAAISATVRDRPGYFPAGTDVAVVHPPSALPMPASRPREPLTGGGYLFTVSRLDTPKRIDLLIAAMSHVTARGARLRIAGAGPDADRLHALAADDPRITFTGRVGDAELRRLYAGARGVAFLPHDEDFGLVSLEAMGVGRPVLTTTDAGGPMELVAPGVTGWVVEPDPVAIAGAIDELWASRGRRARMGREARRRAEGVTWDPLVAELERLA